VDDSLYVFAAELTEGNGGVFNFKVTGATLLVIDNVHQGDPMQWTATNYPIPSGYNGTLFANTVATDQSYLYVVGTLPGTYNGALMRVALPLLRKCAHSLLECGEFLTSDQGWSANASEAGVTFPMVPSGGNIFFNKALHKWYFLTLPFLSETISIWTADNLVGPWTNSQPLYTILRPFNDTKVVFCYSVSIHPELSETETDFVFTFMSNTWDPSVLSYNSQFYVPKFVRVTINEQ
jgi:hypothetical protein